MCLVQCLRSVFFSNNPRGQLVFVPLFFFEKKKEALINSHISSSKLCLFSLYYFGLCNFLLQKLQGDRATKARGFLSFYLS